MGHAELCILHKVRDLQRRQQEDAAKEERRLKSIADKEAAEKEKKVQMMQQEEAYALSLQVSISNFSSTAHCIPL